MINTTKIKIAKKYQTMIDKIYKDSDGYWCELKKGYWCPVMECGIIHEETQSELIDKIRSCEIRK